MPPRADVHLLHIGKTGGTAVRHVLEPWLSACPWLHLHRHPTRLADVPAGESVVFFLRDPLDRFVSGFNSRLRKGRPRYDAEWSPEEATAFAAFPTPDALASALSDPDDAVRARAVAAMRGIRHVRSGYWHWLGSPGLLASRADDVLFIGTQEHLADDAAALGRLLGLDLAPLPDDPVDAHRTPAGVETALGTTARDNLRAWHARDYRAIRACARIARERDRDWSIAREGYPPSWPADGRQPVTPAPVG